MSLPIQFSLADPQPEELVHLTLLPIIPQMCVDEVMKCCYTAFQVVPLEVMVAMIKTYGSRWHRVAQSNNSSSLCQHLPRRALHPQLCVPPVRQLELPRQWIEILTLGRCVDEDTLEMERRSIRLVIRADLHGEKSITRAVVLVQRRITTAHNNLHLVSKTAP